MQIDDLQEIIVIRPFDFSIDAPFIFSSWRNSVWYDSHVTDKIDSSFYHQKTQEIKKTISDQKTHIKMAVLKRNPEHLIGYVVINNSVIEFVYVKLDYRKQGVATILCKGLTKVVTPMTKIGASIVKRLKLEVKESNGPPV